MWLSLPARFGLAERYQDYAGNLIEFNEYLANVGGSSKWDLLWEQKEPPLPPRLPLGYKQLVNAPQITNGSIVSGPNLEWYALQGLNLRPLPCEGSALPLS